ncbi:hypothetical protein ARMGADRAFT_1082801 [Armillaria gallica]|uniref:Uncharacterized protein n=1 Tax=Armillaria gallica TaxID=47427 RepID=A0A2H3D5M1_ARMGA|nr:hypothetical protein ARMGADRAFT_1082801 [Armillaria gallica]
MIARMYRKAAVPELTDSQIKEVFFKLDTCFNDISVTVFEGIYTGVVAVTLWAVVSRNNCQDYRRPHFLVFIILVLYLTAAFNLYGEWVLNILYFTTPKWKYSWEAAEPIPDNSTPVILTRDVIAILSTVLADAALIWCCWIVWGRSWRVVININLASRGIVAYHDAFGPNPPPQALFLENIVSWSVLYSSLVLATLLWCTVLIIYRIWRVGAAAGRMYVYQRVIEILVESASLYSAVLVVLLVFEARNELAGIYIEDLAIAMRGIMPTILVGRVAAGHARPDDSWSESTMVSSLQFQNHSISQNDAQMSVGSGWDTSSTIRPDLDEVLEDSGELRMEGAAPTFNAHDCSADVVGTSNSLRATLDQNLGNI